MSATLQGRAERAAAAIISEHGLTHLGLPHDALVPMLAIGWLEGWDAGMNEAKEAVAEVVAAQEHYKHAAAAKGEWVIREELVREPGGEWRPR